MPYELRLTLNPDISKAVLERAAHYNAVARAITQEAAFLPLNVQKIAEETARDYLAAAAGRGCLAPHVTVAAAVAGPGGAAYIEEEHRQLSGPLDSSIQVNRIRAVAVLPPPTHGFEDRGSTFRAVAPLSTSVGREAVERVARQQVLATSAGKVIEYDQNGRGIFGKIAGLFIQVITGDVPGTRRVTYDNNAVEAAIVSAAWKIKTDFVDSVAPPTEVPLAEVQAEISRAESIAEAQYQRAYETVGRDFAPGGDLSGLSPMEAYPSAFDL